MIDLTGAIQAEQGEARMQDCEEYSTEMITHLQQENIRLYMEVRRLKLLYEFNRNMNDILNTTVQDLLGIIGRRDADRA